MATYYLYVALRASMIGQHIGFRLLLRIIVILRMFKSSSRKEYITHKNASQEYFFVSQSLDTADPRDTKRTTRTDTQHAKPRPAGVPVDDAIKITANHLQNTALLCTINHFNTKEKETNQPTSHPHRFKENLNASKSN